VQALLDVYTIQREIGRLNNLRIGLVGDLANGRTVRSLAYLLSMYQGIKFYFVAPDVVRMQAGPGRILSHCCHSTQLPFLWRCTIVADKTYCSPPSDNVPALSCVWAAVLIAMVQMRTRACHLVPG
jgi:hypothetical protein